jgi:hypothetical protein
VSPRLDLPSRLRTYPMQVQLPQYDGRFAVRACRPYPRDDWGPGHAADHDSAAEGRRSNQHTILGDTAQASVTEDGPNGVTTIDVRRDQQRGGTTAR